MFTKRKTRNIGQKKFLEMPIRNLKGYSIQTIQAVKAAAEKSSDEKV